MVKVFITYLNKFFWYFFSDVDVSDDYLSAVKKAIPKPCKKHNDFRINEATLIYTGPKHVDQTPKVFDGCSKIGYPLGKPHPQDAKDHRAVKEFYFQGNCNNLYLLKYCVNAQCADVHVRGSRIRFTDIKGITFKIQEDDNYQYLVVESDHKRKRGFFVSNGTIYWQYRVKTIYLVFQVAPGKFELVLWNVFTTGKGKADDPTLPRLHYGHRTMHPDARNEWSYYIEKPPFIFTEQT